MASGPKNRNSGNGSRATPRPQRNVGSSAPRITQTQGEEAVTIPTLLNADQAAQLAHKYPDSLAPTNPIDTELAEVVDSTQTQGQVEEVDASEGADSTTAADQPPATIPPVPNLVGINSGLPKASVEAAASILLDNPQLNRERTQSEREKKLQQAMADRNNRTVNPVTAAAQAVIQPVHARDVNITPEVQTAYDLINKTMDTYFDFMEPGKTITDEIAAQQQLAMYKLVKSILTNGGPTMRHSMAYLLMIIRKHRTTAFSATYALRGLRGMRGSNLEQEFWRLLMEALVAFCEPEGMALRIKRIDIPRLKIAAQRVEGPHNTTLAGNLGIFITQHTRNAQ